MNCHRPLAIGLAVVVVLSALAPLGAAVAGEDVDGLDVAVSQDDEPLVTVTHNGSAVAGANVSVSTAAADSADVEDPANDTVGENESVNDTVGENDSSDDAYAGVGHYVTDENGTVDLPVPETTVVVQVTVSANNDSASTTATLTGAADDDAEPGSGNFGAAVSAVISDYHGGVPLGFAVATYVVANNPGNAPGHAGPPSHVGTPGDHTLGPPAHAGGPDDTDEEAGNSSDEGDPGPPEHAGGPDDDRNESAGGPDDDRNESAGGPDDDRNESDDGTDPGKSAGPPDHAGGPGDNAADDEDAD